jgi:hypothetical protein
MPTDSLAAPYIMPLDNLPMTGTRYESRRLQPVVTTTLHKWTKKEKEQIRLAKRRGLPIPVALYYGQ